MKKTNYLKTIVTGFIAGAFFWTAFAILMAGLI